MAATAMLVSSRYRMPPTCVVDIERLRPDGRRRQPRTTARALDDEATPPGETGAEPSARIGDGSIDYRHRLAEPAPVALPGPRPLPGRSGDAQRREHSA